MAKSPLPSQERLRNLLDYCPETGELTWRMRPVSDFVGGKRDAEVMSRIRNTRYAGKPALSSAKGNGYLFGAVDGAQLLQHRVIWKWMTGNDPNYVDHINGNRSDNRWANLRSVDQQSNMRNMRLSKANKSGRVGVMLAKGKWRAFASVHNKSFSLGTFSSFSDAVKAREEWEVANRYHANHGAPLKSYPFIPLNHAWA